MTESLELLVPDSWAGMARRTWSRVLTVVRRSRSAPWSSRRSPARRSSRASPWSIRAAISSAASKRFDCEGEAVVTASLAPMVPRAGASRPRTRAAPRRSARTAACAGHLHRECTRGATKCEGTAGRRTCGQADSDPCLDWASAARPQAHVCDERPCTAAFALTVVKAGTGIGTVTLSPTGIVCGATCTASYVAWGPGYADRHAERRRLRSPGGAAAAAAPGAARASSPSARRPK